MDLKITTIIPTDDSALANRLMKSLIEKNDIVLGIVAGNDDWSKQLIQNVDVVAMNRKEVRHAVWIQNPSLVYDLIEPLFSTGKGFNFPAGHSCFFTVSLSHNVCDLVNIGEPNPDISRIDDAFISAEIG
jgi:hypothetical protein